MARLADNLDSSKPEFFEEDPSISIIPTISQDTILALKSSESINSWILDSGASTHFTHDLENMFDYQTCDVRVEFGKGYSVMYTMSLICVPIFSRPKNFGAKGYITEMINRYCLLKIL